MKVKTWIPLVLAVVLGLAALKLTRDAMSRKDGNAAGGDTAAVVMATREIEPGQRITKGMRAITLRVDEFSSVAGLLVPGSRVDVIAVIGNDAAKGSIARTIVQ